MKPIDKFSFLENHTVSQDMTNLIRFYLPILGLETVSVYAYLVAFWDNGRAVYAFSHILNHVNIGMPVLETALTRLTAMRLIDVYQKDETYQIVLYPVLTATEFLSNQVYKTLLEKKIGQTAVEKMLPASPKGKRLEASFSQVFDLEIQEERTLVQQPAFELDFFKQRMAQDQLRFEDEQADFLKLFAIAEQKKWTWYETYLLAKETAVSGVISIKRMQQKLAQKPISEAFTAQEEALIREAKGKSALLFLAEIKKMRKAVITKTERKALEDMAKLGLLDEVINIILLLTFNTIDSANLNEKYALKVANDFTYQEITSSEEAILRIRERNKERTKRTQESVNRGSVNKSNVPEWSNPHYKNETSPEKQAELDEQKRQLLARLEQGGE